MSGIKVWSKRSAKLLLLAAAPPPPSFPTDAVVDDFNRANVQPPGSAWLGSFSAGWRVASNQLVNLSGGWDGIYWNATPEADQEGYVTIAQVGANTKQFQIHVRKDYGADTGYFLNVVSNTGGNETIQLWKRIASADTQLGSDDTSINLAAGDGLGISVSGSTIYAWHKPAAGAWTLVMDETDGAITAAGVIALYSNDTGWILDDFGGPAVAVPTILTPPLLTHTRTIFAPAKVSPQLRPAMLTHTRTIRTPAKVSPTLKPSMLTHTRVIYDLGDIDVTLRPNALTHTRTVHTPLVSPQLRPAALTHARTIFSPTIAGGEIILLPAALTHTRTLHGPQVNPQIRPAALTHTRTIYSPTMRPILKPAALTHTRTVFSPRVVQLLQPALLTHTRTVHGPRVNVRIFLNHLTHARTIYAPRIPGEEFGGGDDDTRDHQTHRSHGSL